MFGEMGENSFGYFRKKYQKILEKREMSFYSSENKNWTFRGSFCFLSGFSRFFEIFNFYMRNWNRKELEGLQSTNEKMFLFYFFVFFIESIYMFYRLDKMNA